MKIRNAFTVDLEDWFCVQNLQSATPLESWSSQPLRVEQSTLRLLDLLDRHTTTATFFVLGWIAEHCPDLVAEVARRGHEIGCHSHTHSLVSTMTPTEFEQDLVRALDAIGSAVGDVPVLGYRAPSFSITRSEYWAFNVMARNGLRYDSSIFPTGAHPQYGIEDAPLIAHELPGGMLELPMSCYEVDGRRIPFAGGGYLRLYPLRLTRWLIRRTNERHTRPVNLYVHPWELDPDQPRVTTGTSRTQRLRHYTNLRRTESRLEQLLEEFPFGPAAEVLHLTTPANSAESAA